MNQSEVVYHNPENLPKDTIKKVVIWLHGLGANGRDFVPIVPELNLPVAVKFIFPHAPHAPVTVNGGYVMSSWYDILEMGDISRKVDVVGIEKSFERIFNIIQVETTRGVALKDIVIAGFSQGGAVAYHTAMSVQGLGGLMALSTYFATENEFDGHVKADRDLPVLICHGDFDGVVSPRFARLAVESLMGLGFNPVLKTYPIEHNVGMKEIMDIRHWLTEVLA
ncbi:MAG: carboxylesterase [Moraxella sp.]|nr:carboxylesterase [Moraxella sp.]